MEIKNSLLDVGLPEESAELIELYAAVQEQRKCDAERLRGATREREYLQAVISELDETVAELKARANELEGARGQPAILRLTDPNRPPFRGIIARLMGTVLLRFARHFARTERFLEAETLYQAATVFKPRPFLTKQVGNMLYRQGLYLPALDILLEVEEHFEDDREVRFLISASKEALERVK